MEHPDHIFSDELGQSVLSMLNSLSFGIDELSSTISGGNFEMTYNEAAKRSVDEFEEVQSQDDSVDLQRYSQRRKKTTAPLNEDDDDSEDVPAVPGNVFEEPSVFESPTDDILEGVSFEVADEIDMDLEAIRGLCALDSDEQSGFSEDSDERSEEVSDRSSRRFPVPREQELEEEGSSPQPVEDSLDCSIYQQSSEDEWENDDDTGYVLVAISADEFYEMEEESASRLVFEENLKQEVAGWVAASPVSSTEPVAGSPGSPGAGPSPDPEHATPVPEPDLRSQPVVDADVGANGDDEEDVHVGVGLEGAFKPSPRRETQGERRRTEIMGQNRFIGVDQVEHSFFNLKVIFEPYKTGFEESKNFNPPKGTIIAGRYEVSDFLGQAAFSSALQCVDLIAEEGEAQWVCLKVIKNSKDFFDQSLDEIKLLQYINSKGDPNKHHVLQLIDFFYCKEHLFIVSELLRENLYEFGKYVKETGLEPYYTIPRLKKILKQILEALQFIHSLNLVHCDIKPENIVIKSYSRCEVKLIDFGSSCFTSDHLSTYIQSRSYRAPEVIIGHAYDTGIDIWSVGGVLAELHTGYVLFQNDSVATMLARITGILGPFPEQVLAAGKESNKYFTTSGVVYERVDDHTVSLVYPKKTTLASRLHLPTPCVDREDLLFQDIVRQMLHLDPSKRPSATQLLQHPWLDGADELCIPVPNLTVNPPPAPAYEEEDDREGERDDDAEDESGDGPLNYSFGDEDDNAEVDELSEEELSEEAILEVDSGGVEN